MPIQRVRRFRWNERLRTNAQRCGKVAKLMDEDLLSATFDICQRSSRYADLLGELVLRELDPFAMIANQGTDPAVELRGLHWIAIHDHTNDVNVANIVSITHEDESVLTLSYVKC